MYSKNGIKPREHIKNTQAFVQEPQNLLIGTNQTATQTIVDKAIDEQFRSFET